MLKFKKFVSEGYDIFPKSEGEIEGYAHLDPSKIEKLKALFSYVISKSEGMPDPIGLNSKQPNQVKIARAVGDNFDVSKLSKEYGFRVSLGDGSRGGRGSASKGFSFEDKIVDDITTYIEEGITSQNFKFVDMIRVLHALYFKNAENISVIKEGEKNTKRPLVFGDVDAVIGGRELQIGHKITDVTVNVDGRPIYISAKYGGTVTFFNAGVKTIFPDKEFEDGQIKNKNGLKLLKMFGIDPKRFVEVFVGYDKSSAKKKAEKDIVNTTSIANKKALQRLLLTGIGYGYVMAHQKGKKVETYEMTRSRMKSSAKIQSVKVEYPKKGQAKRIDIEVITPLYIFKLNIRNKQGGLYPSHIMCDYKPNPIGK